MSFVNNKLTPKVTLRHVLDQNRVSESFSETQTPAFTLLDASLDYRITSWVSVRLGVNNLFNTNYYEHLSRTIQAQGVPVYAPGRNVFFAINTRFI
jgi:iron complex outermembrane recepter protein